MNDQNHTHNTTSKSLAQTSAQATLHCLTGCVIGEVIGLAVGVHYGLGMWPTIIFATVLAYLIGFGLSIVPIMRQQQLSFASAFHSIWLGEAISIGVMEVIMNAVDVAVGGVMAMSLTDPIFYIGLAAAIPAGFLAGWPVNYVLLKKQVKQHCH